MLRRLASLLLGGWLAAAAAAPAEPPLPPAYGGLGYRPPAAGSYRLPVLGPAPDGRVLDEEGRERSLHDLFAGRYVLLSFIYSSCSDANGCPLSSYVFYRIKAAMEDDPLLARRLRLISLSFDPANDTPEVMRLYGANFAYAGSAGEWRFLTTASEEALAPILRGYDQDIQRRLSLDGNSSGFAHILRVFLIDPQRRIRNIYSVAFLHPDLLLADVRTLLAEEQARGGAARTGVAAPVASGVSGPGDDKQGYESADYRTRARDLERRRDKGRPLDLLALARNPPLGLPPPPVPVANPLTREKIALGRLLFFDRRLSLNGTVSCAMCHVPEQGFTSNEMATAVGIEGHSVRRNTPTVLNSAYPTRLFHDGREENLEQQVWGPLLARNEMGNPSVGSVLERIRAIPGYLEAFAAAFGERGLTMDTLGMALASYERTLLAADSPFDRWYYGGDEEALSAAAKRGFRLFTGKAGCVACHPVGKEHALFTDHSLRNTGTGYRESMGIRPSVTRVQLAPGVFAEVDNAVIDAVGEPPPADLGRYEITQDPRDRWRYRVPSLRNVAVTAPYMHNGSLRTLEEVVAFYDRGGVPNPELDPAIRPLGLSAAERADLIAFLESLTAGNLEALVADAFAAPVGDLASGPVQP